MIPLLGALALAAGVAGGELRPQLAEAVARGDPVAALEQVRAARAVEPALDRLGLAYLEGRLLATSGDPAAPEALARGIGSAPALAPWARLDLARLALNGGRAAEAAGAALALTGEGTPGHIPARALDLLRAAAARSGGCGVIVATSPAPASRREAERRLALLAADCAAAAGRLDEAARRWQALLAARDDDRVAQEIVDRLAAQEASARTAPALDDALVGRAFARHRDFRRAVPPLERALERAPPAGHRRLARELARARFWEGDLDAAAAALAALAEGPGAEAGERAEARHMEGRARELAGDLAGARTAYAAALVAAPRGEWAGASLLAQLRLARGAGDDSAALAALDRLSSRGISRSARARGLLFAAVSDLVAGRADRAGTWLAAARATGEVARAEIAYWQGRRAEISGRTGEAVASYGEAIAASPYHPFAAAASRRLRQTTLAASAAASAARLAGGPPAEQIAAWALRRGMERADAGLDRRLVTALAAAHPAGRDWIDLEPAPPVSWPLWQSRDSDPETLLLGLGLWSEGAGAAERHFPARKPSLALAAIERLGAAGEARRALGLAERLAGGAPRALPEPLFPPRLRDALAPVPFRTELLAAAARHAVDPRLLFALAREESRFDPTAFSPASARGLTQFVLPTARRLAAALGRPPLRAADLDRPEIALDLAAAHVAELLDRFGGRIELAVAAYNAGERQAEAWQRACLSNEPEELLSKVGFRETRGYLARVLSSLARYRERPGPIEGP